jgi:hypothetical protein
MSETRFLSDVSHIAHSRVTRHCTKHTFSSDVPHIAQSCMTQLQERTKHASRVTCHKGLSNVCVTSLWRSVGHATREVAVVSFLSDVSHFVVQSARTSFAPPFDATRVWVLFHSAHRSFAPPFGGTGGTGGTVVGRFTWRETHRITVCIWWGVSPVWSLK